MAIQNFLSGGFYGSIGEMTGRRWKNKRVLQEKFKPANPRTPAQERQRQLFTQGSALAKIAQQVNWHAPQFTNPIKTDWNQRQTVAINALKEGLTDWEALPLAPKDFKAQHIIGSATLKKMVNANEIEILFEGTNLLEAKKYACALFIQSGNKKGQIVVGSTPRASVDALTAVFRLPDTSGIIGEDVYIKIASIDDKEIDTVTLSAGLYLQQDTEKPYRFEPQVTGIEYDNAGTLRVMVKIGQEEIESYGEWTDIDIRIYDKAWTKETAINANKLDTDNWQNINQQLKIIRTTVAKTTATITFACSFDNAYIYEKFAAKLDISFGANNVKGAETKENSETISLSAVAFPEYIQPEYDGRIKDTLAIPSAKPTVINGIAYLGGNPTMQGYTSDSQSVLAFPKDWETYEESTKNMISVTTSNGKTFSGDELQELFDEYGLDIGIGGKEIGWKIDGVSLNSARGQMGLCINFPKGKMALKGYRVFNIPKNEYDDTTMWIYIVSN